MKLAVALTCFLIACFIGYIFIYLGRDTRGGWPISPAIIYFGMVVWAFPFWLFTFVPPFLLAPAKSIFWRWYVAPIAGGLIGLLASLIVFGKIDETTETGTIQIFFTPIVIGFSLFLMGLIAKRSMVEGSNV